MHSGNNRDRAEVDCTFGRRKKNQEPGIFNKHSDAVCGAREEKRGGGPKLTRGKGRKENIWDLRGHTKRRSTKKD